MSNLIYKVTVQGPVPDSIKEKMAQAQFQAVKAKKRKGNKKPAR